MATERFNSFQRNVPAATAPQPPVYEDPFPSSSMQTLSFSRPEITEPAAELESTVRASNRSAMIGASNINTLRGINCGLSLTAGVLQFAQGNVGLGLLWTGLAVLWGSLALCSDENNDSSSS